MHLVHFIPRTGLLFFYDKPSTSTTYILFYCYLLKLPVLAAAPDKFLSIERSLFLLYNDTLQLYKIFRLITSFP